MVTKLAFCAYSLENTDPERCSDMVLLILLNVLHYFSRYELKKVSCSPRFGTIDCVSLPVCVWEDPFLPDGQFRCLTTGLHSWHNLTSFIPGLSGTEVEKLKTDIKLSRRSCRVMNEQDGAARFPDGVLLGSPITTVYSLCNTRLMIGPLPSSKTEGNHLTVAGKR